MIIVKLNKPEFEYDIHSLIKAFYANQDVSVTAEDKVYEEPAIIEMQVTYQEHSIRISWQENHFADSKNAESEAKNANDAVDLERIELSGREFTVNFSDRTETKNLLKKNLYQI